MVGPNFHTLQMNAIATAVPTGHCYCAPHVHEFQFMPTCSILVPRMMLTSHLDILDTRHLGQVTF